MYVETAQGTTTLQSVSITGNRGNSGGGANLVAQDGSIRITDSVIAHNVADVGRGTHPGKRQRPAAGSDRA